jgi:gamma-glutamyl:cysteine ligase YbdK (ATP-grasp superfamily)
MLVPNQERQREINQQANLYARAFRLALDYVMADQGSAGRALLRTVERKLSRLRPEQTEWATHQAIQRGKEIMRRENEQAEAETAADMAKMAAAKHTGRRTSSKRALPPRR